MSGGRTGAAVKRAGAVLGALAVCAFAGEAALRLLAPFPEHGSRAIHSFPDTYHPLLGWTGVPNLDTVFTLPDFSHRIRNTHRGFRDRDHAREKAGKRRIVVLGDSTAWGWGVEAEERFSDRMERMLPGWEVLNLAQAGYSTDQELPWRRRGSPMAPSSSCSSSTGTTWRRGTTRVSSTGCSRSRGSRSVTARWNSAASPSRATPSTGPGRRRSPRPTAARRRAGGGGIPRPGPRPVAPSHNWISFRLTHPARRGEGKKDGRTRRSSMRGWASRNDSSPGCTASARNTGRASSSPTSRRNTPRSWRASAAARDTAPRPPPRAHGRAAAGAAPAGGALEPARAPPVAGAAVDFLEREGLPEGRAERQGRGEDREGVKAGRCEGAGVRECEV